MLKFYFILIKSYFALFSEKFSNSYKVCTENSACCNKAKDKQTLDTC